MPSEGGEHACHLVFGFKGVGPTLNPHTPRYDKGRDMPSAQSSIPSTLQVLFLCLSSDLLQVGSEIMPSSPVQ
jgi:hypothetical protein